MQQNFLLVVVVVVDACAVALHIADRQFPIHIDTQDRYCAAVAKAQYTLCGISVCKEVGQRDFPQWHRKALYKLDTRVFVQCVAVQYEL